MKVRVLKVFGEKTDILNACRTTVNLESLDVAEVGESFMTKLYRSEHSPIRIRQFLIEVENIPSWIATHFVRHNVGCTPFISTSREDRNTEIVDRDSLPQGKLVRMEWLLNAQAIINISKVRLCRNAHPRTTKAWQEILKEIKKHDKELVDCCVPSCVYRGFCPEVKTCGYTESQHFILALSSYRERIK